MFLDIVPYVEVVTFNTDHIVLLLLSSELKIEGVWSSETLANSQNTTRRNNLGE
jgi:hypothetical protein